MKIRLLSDLHVECGFVIPDEYYKNYGEDVLVLAGDIGDIKDVHLTLNRFDAPTVLFVPGNHCWYHNNWYDRDELIANLKANVNPNVQVLDNETINIKGARFAGSTMWSNFNYSISSAVIAKQYINDFNYINGLGVNDMMLECDKADIFLQEAKADVIITHFVPSLKLINVKYVNVNPTTTSINDYFAPNVLVEEFENKPKLWLYGHTHYRSNKKLYGVRCITNPKGYNGEIKTPYHYSKLIKI